MKDIKGLFLISAGLLASIPGLTLISQNLSIPPGESKMLYGGLANAFGTMTLLILWLKREKIKKLSTDAAVKRAILFISLFIVSLVAYIWLFESFIVQDVIFPFFPAGDLLTTLKQNKHDFNDVIKNFHVEGTQLIISKSSASSLLLTKIVFMMLFLISLNFLIIAFGIIGVNLSKSTKPEKNEQTIK